MTFGFRLRPLRVLVALSLVSTTAAIGLVGIQPASASAFVDKPNTRTAASALPASPNNSWRRDVIDAADDVDWYKFTVATSGYIRITLGDLPADYSLDLFTATGSLVASSHQSGVMFERIYRPVHADSYFVRVKSAAGAFDAVNAYSLMFQPLAERVIILNWAIVPRAEYPDYNIIEGDVLNNTAQWREVIIVAQRLDIDNEPIPDGFLGAAFGSTVVVAMAPRSVAHFMVFDTEPPLELDHYRLGSFQDTTKNRPISGVTLSPDATSDVAGTRHFPGHVTNNSGMTLKYLVAIAAYYDARGRLLQFWFDVHNNVANHASPAYEVTMPALAANLTQYQAVGDNSSD
jgi:hypothetical protein